nr:hypothetical protein [Corynebacterium cystitidis]
MDLFLGNADERYCTCAEYGSDCVPDPLDAGKETGVRIAFVCPTRGSHWRITKTVGCALLVNAEVDLAIAEISECTDSFEKRVADLLLEFEVSGFSEHRWTFLRRL